MGGRWVMSKPLYLRTPGNPAATHPRKNRYKNAITAPAYSSAMKG
jgi:hypothetical protein